jgi:parvulin-like peptidyl-prolyl isomerase
MPNPKNKEIDNGEIPVSQKLTRTQIKQRQLRILLLAIVVVAVLAIAGAILYQTYMAPYQRVVLKVDDRVVKMDYFLKRCQLANDDIEATITQLEYEEIVKIEAKELGFSVADIEIEKALRSDAANSDNISESELTDEAFNKWYREQLKSTGLTNAQYRDTTRTSLMAVGIRNAIVSNIPDTLEQVHLHAIVVSSASEAAQVKVRLDGGEDFATVARQVSIDSSTNANGGDIGWVPEGLLTTYDSVIFSLNVGQISDPIVADSTSSTSAYLILMVSEKDAAHAVDENMKQSLSASSFSTWLSQQVSEHTITVNLDTTTQSWIEWQLAKE